MSCLYIWPHTCVCLRASFALIKCQIEWVIVFSTVVVLTRTLDNTQETFKESLSHSCNMCNCFDWLPLLCELRIFEIPFFTTSTWTRFMHAIIIREHTHTKTCNRAMSSGSFAMIIVDIKCSCGTHTCWRFIELKKRARRRRNKHHHRYENHRRERQRKKKKRNGVRKCFALNVGNQIGARVYVKHMMSEWK